MLPISLATTALLPREAFEDGGGSINDKHTLSPLPRVLRQGLTAVTVLGLLSLVCALALFVHLVYRLIISRHQRLHRNQFLVLIVNLLFADILQSTAFGINVEWLRRNAVEVGTNACWAQGFFLSVGDLASGVFTIAIAVHIFVDVVFNYKPGYTLFLFLISFCHMFVYACAVIGIALHPSDFYVRAGAWCWVNSSYQTERLWLHYFWIMVAELGTIFIYSGLFYILQRRLKTNYYNTPGTAERAKAAARSIIPYPVIYAVCTLPLAATRVATMEGSTPTYGLLVVCASMITSNGWLDVLLYCLTRRALIFGSEPLKEDMRALDTFYWKPQEYGTTTHIEAMPQPATGRRRFGGKGGFGTRAFERNGSTDGLVLEDLNDDGMRVRKEVKVSSQPAGMQLVKGEGRRVREEDQGSATSKKSWMKDDWI